MVDKYMSLHRIVIVVEMCSSYVNNKSVIPVPNTGRARLIRIRLIRSST